LFIFTAIIPIVLRLNPMFRFLWCLTLCLGWSSLLMGQRCGVTDTIPIGAFGDTTLMVSIEDYLNDDLANADQGVCGVRLYFQHSYVYDFTVTMTSPAGQSVELIGPVNNQTRSPTNLVRWFIDFLACDSTAMPDVGAPEQWNNNDPFNWVFPRVYTGDYFPANGCFGDFNTGPVNGDWSFTFSTQRTGQQAQLTYLLIDFCDDRNAQGPCCFANAGDLQPDPPMEACSGDPTVSFPLSPRYASPRPDASEYGYTYVVSRNDSVLYLQDDPDLAGFPPGDYQICGFSYRRDELSQLPLDGSFSMNDLRNDLNAVTPTLCGDLSEDCQFVTLYAPPDTVFLDATICVGDFFRVGNTNYTTTDLHTTILPAQGGCDSVIVLDLMVVNEKRTTVDTTICAEAVFPQGGNVYDAPGTYLDTLTAVAGCDSIVTLNLNFAPPIVKDTTVAICAGGSFSIAGETFTEQNTYQRVLPAANGCDSTINLDLIVLDPEIVFSPLSPGITCDNPQLLLDATGSQFSFGLNFRWLDTLGAVIGTNLTLGVDTAGLYIFELTETHLGASCTVRDTVTVQDLRFSVRPNGALTQVQCGPGIPCNLLSCRNPTIGLAALASPVGPAYDYTWTPPAGASIAGQVRPEEVLVDLPGDYTLRIEDPATGCFVDTVFTIDLDTLAPSLDIAGNELLTCANTNILLTADSNQTRSSELDFRWTGDCLPGPVTGPSLRVNCPGEITLTITNRTNGCLRDTTFSVFQDTTAARIDLAPATAPISCFEPQRLLDGSGSSSANGLDFVWTYEGLTDTVSQFSTHTTDLAGTYTLRVTDVRSRCVATADIVVPADTLAPIADAGPDTLTLNCYTPAHLLGGRTTSAGPDFVYAWTQVSEPLDTLGRDIEFLVEPPGGRIQLTVVDTTNGCLAIDQVRLPLALDTPFIRLEPPLDFDCFIDSVLVDASRTNLNYDNIQTWTGPCLPTQTDTNQIWVGCPGIYVYEVFNLETGCRSRDSVTVALADNSVVAVLPDTVLLDCESGVAQIDRSAGTDAPIVRWFREGNPVELVGQQPTVTIPGRYTLVLGNFNESCLDTAFVEVVANCPVFASIVPPDSLTCAVARVTLDARPSTPPDGPSIEVEWIVPSGATTLPGPSLRQLEVFSPGRYGLAIRNQISGMGDTTYVDVRRNVVEPSAEAGPRDTINCYNPMVALDASRSTQGPEFEYLWTNTNDDTISFDQRVMVGDPGTYLLRVTQRFTGCSRVDNVTIIRDLDVPNLAFTSAVIPCDTTNFPLAVIPNPGGDYTIQWAGPFILGDNEQDTVRISEVGTYIVTVTDLSNGCPAVDSVEVTRFPCPPFPALPDTSLTCRADTLELAPSFREPCVNCTYRWTRNGITIPGQNDSILPVTEVGTYGVIIFNQFGLRGEATGAVTETRILPVANAGPDRMLSCDSLSVLLGNDAPEPNFAYTYQWLDEMGVAISGATNDHYRVSTGGLYQLATTNLFSLCTEVDTVLVGYDTLAPIADAGPTRILDCNNPRRVLDGLGSSFGPSMRYNWTGGPSTACIEGENSLNPIVSCGATYRLEVRDTSNGCFASATVFVDADDELPELLPQTDTLINCANPQIILDGVPPNRPNLRLAWTEVTSMGEVPLPAGPAPGQATVDRTGNYRFEATDTLNGCSNDFSLFVGEDFILPTVEAGISDTFFCELDSLVISGTSRTDSGREANYQWTSQTGFFISSSDRSDAAIFQPDTYFLTATDPRNGCPATDSVIIFRDIEAPFAFAGPDTTLTCIRRQVRLNGGAQTLSGQADYFWTTLDGSIIRGQQQPNPLVNLAGRYQLNVTDPGNDCTAADIVQVREDTIPPVARITGPNNLELDCRNPEIELSGRSSAPRPLDYLWRGPANAPPTGSITDPSLTVGVEGTYRLIITNPINGCRDTTTSLVEADFTPPSVRIIDPDPLTCVRDSLILRPVADDQSGLDQYRWLDVNGQFLSRGDQITIFEQGTFLLETTNVANGCRDTTRRTVSANRVPPTVTLADPLILNCVRSVTNVDGTGSSRGFGFVAQWESPGNTHVVSADPYIVRGTEPGFYFLTVTNQNNGCATRDSIEVLRSAVPVTDLLLDVEQPACLQDPFGSVVVTGVVGGTGPYRFRLDGGVTSDRLVYENLPTGRYTLEVVDVDGCSLSNSFNLNPGPQITVDLRPDTLIRLGDSISLDFTTNLPAWDTLIWTSSGPLPAFSSAGPITVRPFTSQGFRLVVEDANGCSATDEVIIEVDETVDTYVPNAFSPNGDNVNDRIRPFTGPQVAEILDFRIFDRWGELIYDMANDPDRGGEDFGWDGRLNGRMMNPQVFVWQLSVRLVDGLEVWRYGEVVLMR
jgi:gliding motility-associated-like protein